LPLGLHARRNAIDLHFTDALDPASANNANNYAIKVWSLKRSADYGSKHFNEHTLSIGKASLATDQKSVSLEIPELQPTWCMEIKCVLQAATGEKFTRTIHNTIHQLGSAHEAQGHKAAETLTQ
jgi:hypothetical protein